MKTAIIGYSCAGKSTLAQRLGKFYGCPVLHLDKINFEPGWKERDANEARALVLDFMKKASWVIDGNYRKFYRQRRLAEADLILFLDFPPLTCLHRAFVRYKTYKNRARDSMAPGCPEKLDLEFILWILLKGRTAEFRRVYREVAETYPEKIRVFQNQRQVDAFLRELGA